MSKVALDERASSHVHKIAGNNSHTPLNSELADAAGGPLPARQRTMIS